jgi:hypothetical protein
MAALQLCDPRDPGAPRRLTGKYKKPQIRRSRGMLSGIIASALAILIMFFAMGFFPQVNDWFADSNATLASHNDAIVATIIRYLPLALILFGSGGLVAMIVNHTRQRVSA